MWKCVTFFLYQGAYGHETISWETLNENSVCTVPCFEHHPGLGMLMFIYYHKPCKLPSDHSIPIIPTIPSPNTLVRRENILQCKGRWGRRNLGLPLPVTGPWKYASPPGPHSKGRHIPTPEEPGPHGSCWALTWANPSRWISGIGSTLSHLLHMTTTPPHIKATYLFPFSTSHNLESK